MPLTFNYFFIIACVRVALTLARARILNIKLTLMDGIIEIFDKFGFSVALSITLLIFVYRIVNRQIKYLQDTIKELSAIIAKNTEIYKLLYDYLTKN